MAFELMMLVNRVVLRLVMTVVFVCGNGGEGHALCLVFCKH